MDKPRPLGTIYRKSNGEACSIPLEYAVQLQSNPFMLPKIAKEFSGFPIKGKTVIPPATTAPKTLDPEPGKNWAELV